MSFFDWLLRRDAGEPAKVECPRCKAEASAAAIECPACHWDLREAYREPARSSQA